MRTIDCAEIGTHWTPHSALVAARTPSSWGFEAPEQWMFCDDGHSGATLVRPALAKMRHLVAHIPVEVVLVYSPDRSASKYASQALLIEEFAKSGIFSGARPCGVGWLHTITMRSRVWRAMLGRA
ncbi:MAG TPA: recombinase family protein [Pseudonocardiaceae bacterium]|nr:recombinase family protein [Pseudonocardiaceae bacterium]